MTVGAVCSVVGRLLHQYPCHPLPLDALLVVGGILAGIGFHIRRSSEGRQRLAIGVLIVGVLLFLIPVFTTETMLSEPPQLERPAIVLVDATCDATTDTVNATFDRRTPRTAFPDRVTMTVIGPERSRNRTVRGDPFEQGGTSGFLAATTPVDMEAGVAYRVVFALPWTVSASCTAG